METELKHMKTMLSSCMDKLPSHNRYAAAVKQSGSPPKPVKSQNRAPVVADTVINISAGPDTHPITDSQPRAWQLRKGVEQEIPVVISDRQQSILEIPDLSTNNDTRESARNKTVLLIGDSILKGVNTRGLQQGTGVQKHSTSGATLHTLIDEIVRYDLRTFSHVIIYIGGNDVANKVNMELFEETYDHLSV